MGGKGGKGLVIIKLDLLSHPLPLSPCFSFSSLPPPSIIVPLFSNPC